MTTPELKEFVRNELAVGGTRESITPKLKAQGWNDLDIAETFSSISQVQPSPIHFSPTDTQVVSVMPNRSRKFLKLLLSLLVLIILICGTALAYAFGYIVSFQKISSQSLQATHKATTALADMTMVIDASAVKGFDPAKDLLPGMSPIFNIKVKGSSDVTDTKNPKTDITFSATSGTVEADFNARIIDKKFYMELTKAPSINFFSLEPFENKWISFPYTESDMKKDPLLSSSGIDTKSFKELTDEQKKHIDDLVEKAHFIKITGKHLPEMINGSAAFHFDFDLDHDGIIDFAKEIVAYLKTIDTDNKYDLSSVKDSDYDKIFNALRSFHGEAWVGMFDHLPYKFSINADIQNPDAPSDGLVKVSTTATYTNWNKPVSIVAPDKSMALDELISSVMGGQPNQPAPDPNSVKNTQDLRDAKGKANDAAKKSIISNLRPQAEVFYSDNNDSYTGFCKSKAHDGAYVIAKGLPANTEYKCNDISQNWAAWAKLSTGEYQCADSTGFTGAKSTLPKGTSCN